MNSDKMPKSPSAYEKFICENVLKNSQKFQQQQHETTSENLICESFKRIKSGKDMQESDESESEIDLTTTTSPQNSFVLDFSNNNNNNSGNNRNNNGDK